MVLYTGDFIRIACSESFIVRVEVFHDFTHVDPSDPSSSQYLDACHEAKESIQAGGWTNTRGIVERLAQHGIVASSVTEQPAIVFEGLRYVEGLVIVASGLRLDEEIMRRISVFDRFENNKPSEGDDM